MELSPLPKQFAYHELDKTVENISVFYLLKNPHVAIVALNRPEKRNAMNAKMWREIGEVFSCIGSTGDGCRCVLLIGHGKGFCSGIDITDPGLLMDDGGNDVDGARKYLSVRHKILEMQRAFTMIEECPVPVVAAVHGPCVGGGIDLICCADIRVCSPSAKFGVREVRIGLAADIGTLQRLPKIVGYGSRVKELCYTGEDFYADEARSIGFISRISESDSLLFPLAMQICQNISRNSPVAVSGTKMSLNYSRDHSVRDGLEHIAAHNATALMTEDIPISLGAMSLEGNASAKFSNLLPHAKL